MWKFVFVLMLFAAGTITINAQRPSSWERLVTVQKEEREALHLRQDSEIKLLIQIQQSSIKAISRDRASVRDAIQKHIAERERLLTRQAAERTDLSRIHEKERRGLEEKPMGGEIVSIVIYTVTMAGQNL